MTKNDIVKKIVSVLEKHEEKVLFAYLFGSTARAETAPSGDIDIAVFLAGGTRESHLEMKLSLYADFCRALKRNDVDVVILNTAVNLVLLDEIVRTGVILHDSAPEARADFELAVIHNAFDFKSHRLSIMGV